MPSPRQVSFFIVLLFVTVLVQLSAANSFQYSNDDAMTEQEEEEEEEAHYDMDPYDESDLNDETPLDESDRLIEYYKRNYTWPLETFQPNTEGWKRIYERRFRQIERIEDVGQRYDAWSTSIGSALVIPNFTESGWGLTRAPDHITNRLKSALHSHLNERNQQEEELEPAIYGDLRPLYFRDDELNDWVLSELHPLHEAWAGVDLVGNNAYGLRVYRDGSSLLMHIDQPNTHVISCILHIDHSEDSEPWPLVIEDFQGNTNEVFLESGDLLFYESSKCLHGRPRTFHGSWYSSIFVHYYPKNWDTNFHEEFNFAVPPHWSEDWNGHEDDGLEQLVMTESAMEEPECDNGWCSLTESKKWKISTELGKVESTHGQSVLNIRSNIMREDEL